MLDAAPALALAVDADFKSTPLHWAFHGREEIVAELLARKANAEAVNKDGRRPLHFAVVSGQAGIIGKLLARGAEKGAEKMFSVLSSEL